MDDFNWLSMRLMHCLCFQPVEASDELQREVGAKNAAPSWTRHCWQIQEKPLEFQVCDAWIQFRQIDLQVGTCLKWVSWTSSTKAKKKLVCFWFCFYLKTEAGRFCCPRIEHAEVDEIKFSQESIGQNFRNGRRMDGLIQDLLRGDVCQKFGKSRTFPDTM